MSQTVDVRVSEVGQQPPFVYPPGTKITFTQVQKGVVLQAGTAQGNSTISLIGETESGEVVILEITARLLDLVQAISLGARKRWGESTECAPKQPK